MSGMGPHYRIPKLSEFAREQIEKLLRTHWKDGAFLGAVRVGLEYKDDHELHMVLFSAARSHLYSLIATHEFDPSWVLRSFRGNLRDPASKENESPTSFELEELRKRVSDLQIERDELEHRLAEEGNLTTAQALDAELDELRRNIAELSASKEDLYAENVALRSQLDDLRTKLEAALS